MSLFKKVFGYSNKGQAPFVPFYCKRIKNLLKRRHYSKKKSTSYDALFGNSATLEGILRSLEKTALSYVSSRDVDKKETFKHVNTFLHSNRSYNLLANKTFCKALINRYRVTQNSFYLNLLEECSEYLVSKKQKNGIYRYEQPIGLEQDEGPVTAGAIFVLTELYNLTKKEKYLKESVDTACSAVTYLKNDKNGYLHTIGFDIMTTNVNSTFAVAFYKLFLATKEKWLLDETDFCISKVLSMQTQNGLFLYSSKTQSIYKSFYHFMVINSLVELKQSGYTNIDLSSSIEKAINYGKSLIIDYGLVKEQSNEYLSLFQSCTRAAISFELLNQDKIANTICSSFSLFVKDDDVLTSVFALGNRLKITDGSFWYRKEAQIMDIYDDVTYLYFIRKAKQIND